MAAMYIHQAIVVSLLSASAALGEDKPKVTLFYESFCPDCIEFMKMEVLPVWEEFGSSIVLDLIPFGNADQSYIDGKFVFHCQHGPKECIGNKLHACAIEQGCGAKGSVGCSEEAMTKVLKYIVCVEKSRDEEAATPQCAKEVHLDPNGIVQCAKSVQGDLLLSHYGNRTAEFKPEVTWVPTVAINGVRDKDAEGDLKSELCKTEPTLPGCHDLPSVKVV